MNLRLYDTLETLSIEAAKIISDLIKETLKKQEIFTLALSGGHSPKRLYEILGEMPYMETIKWNRVRIFWSDERFVAGDDPQSNYNMAKTPLILKVPVPKENVYRMRTETLSLEKAAQLYEEQLKEFFPESDEVPSFDLLLLGMGTDGHTASLFPKSPALEERERWVVGVSNPNVEPHERITLTFPILNRAKNTIFVVAGDGKKKIIDEIAKDPEEAAKRYPAAMLKPRGKVLWMAEKDRG